MGQQGCRCLDTTTDPSAVLLETLANSCAYAGYHGSSKTARAQDPVTTVERSLDREPSAPNVAGANATRKAIAFALL